MALFDAHCHLQDPRLRPGLVDALTAARDAGVAGWSVCAEGPGDWAEVLDLAARERGVVPSLGVHPWNAGELPAGWCSRLAGLLGAHPAAGVGEVGLDLQGQDLPPVEVQEAVLRDQVALARDLRRPLSLHGVRAWGRILELLAGFGPHPAAVVCHSFGGPADLVAPLAGLGAVFSFSGTVTRARATRVRAAARAVPADRLLVETDAPDLLPALDRAPPLDAHGKPVNEPRNLRVVLRALAEVRGEPEAEVEARTWENGCRAFGGAA